MRCHFIFCLLLSALVSSRWCTGAESKIQVVNPQSEPSSILTQRWAVRLPKETNVAFRGIANTDSAGGGAGAMLYPAPNVAGFFAALITHGLLNNATRNAEMNRIQSTANKILDPYRENINNFRNDELYSAMRDQKRSLSNPIRIALFEEAPSDEWFFIIDPIVSMTQDQKALILDSVILVYAPNSPSMPAFQNVLRVVSAPINSNDPLAYWNEMSGINIKNTSAQLLSMALELAAIESIKSPQKENAPASNPRTVRYFHGASEKIERAELLRISCERAVIRTLRGGLMWVPLKQPHAYVISEDAPPLQCEALQPN